MTTQGINRPGQELPEAILAGQTAKPTKQEKPLVGWNQYGGMTFREARQELARVKGQKQEAERKLAQELYKVHRPGRELLRRMSRHHKHHRTRPAALQLEIPVWFDVSGLPLQEQLERVAAASSVHLSEPSVRFHIHSDRPDVRKLVESTQGCYVGEPDNPRDYDVVEVDRQSLEDCVAAEMALYNDGYRAAVEWTEQMRANLKESGEKDVRLDDPEYSFQQRWHRSINTLRLLSEAVGAKPRLPGYKAERKVHAIRPPAHLGSAWQRELTRRARALEVTKKPFLLVSLDEPNASTLLATLRQQVDCQLIEVNRDLCRELDIEEADESLEAISALAALPTCCGYLASNNGLATAGWALGIRGLILYSGQHPFWDCVVDRNAIILDRQKIQGDEQLLQELSVGCTRLSLMR